MNKIKVVIVDDHTIIRDGLVSLFKGNNEIEITTSLENGACLLEAMETETFDVVLLDMDMPVMNGLDTAAEVLKKHPTTKILIHTMSESVENIELLVKLGIQGYVLKTAGQDELTMAIKVVAHGNSYFNSSILNSFINSCLTESTSPLDKLENGELMVLKYLCDADHTIDTIAAKMNITEERLLSTIKWIKQKLNLNSDLALGKFCGKHYREIMVIGT
jgi:DNA-binding NarL/FixJ family response regulator